MSSLSISNNQSTEPTRRTAPRSVSDTGPPRMSSSLSLGPSSQSSGNASPLATVQAARTSGLTGRPPSSAGPATSGLAGGLGKLPAGMQAKMMAVTTPLLFLMSSYLSLTASLLSVYRLSIFASYFPVHFLLL
jgi:hypothetical protein